MPLLAHRPTRARPAPPRRSIPVLPSPPRKRWRWWWGIVIGSGIVGLLVPALLFLHRELPSSDVQARYLSAVSQQLSFAVEPGPSPLTRYPTTGPYDVQLGYVGLPRFLQRLRALGFDITAQARISPTLARVVDAGLFTVYDEKTQAGLRLLERDGQVVFSALYPARTYRDFDEIPPVVLNTLLFIENRTLFDTRYPHRNPAVEWDRFGLAVFNTLARTVGFHSSRSGGSTLATQLEKFRHSPGGQTVSVREKLRQMGSASLRAYLHGPDTLQARRATALAYVNSMPLAAVPGDGEVHGLGDGLWAWYGADVATVNRLLRAEALSASLALSAEQAAAYRQVLCLLLAQRRPAYYLGDGYAALQTLADSYVRLMISQGVIPVDWRAATLRARVPLRSYTIARDTGPFAPQKTVSILRTRLAQDLGVGRLYDVDHLDLTVTSTLDQTTQHAVTEALRNLRSRERTRAAGLIGERLLGEKDDFTRVVYSFMLYERSPQGNLLRVQADNYEQPLDINEGIRLDLGSTAKLRTLVHYLELIAELHQRYMGQPSQALRALEIDRHDHLSQWVIERLQVTPQMSLQALLHAALERQYSASPAESFFTGGGLHSFGNFEATENHKMFSVRQALRDSVNLVYIRLMRDIVYHYLYRPGAIARQMESADAPPRRAYLERFADREGQVFLRRFYAKYHGKSPQEAVELLTHSVPVDSVRLATLYRSVYPEHGLAAFTDHLRAHRETQGLSEADITRLYDTYSPERFDLPDRGYLAHLHPLELWLVEYIVHHPYARLAEVTAASTQAHQQVYSWLFKTSRKHAQDRRIQVLLEIEAFTQIHHAWQRLGYPFETFTPSYGSAIGASGDRPAALAALIGILLNNGVRSPRVLFETFHFAADTPYETRLARPPARGERLLAPEVAATAREALIDVVEAGTARRLKGVYQRPDRQPLQVGGKTGTGDHRRNSYGAHGGRSGTRVVSRAATFVFFLGERFFGVVTAYVNGPEAARYHFTSALPVQVLKGLAPTLTPLLERAQEDDHKRLKEPLPAGLGGSHSAGATREKQPETAQRSPHT